MSRFVFRIPLFLLATTLIYSIADARPRYRIRPIGTRPGVWVVPNALNNHGEVAGAMASGGWRAFRWSPAYGLTELPDSSTTSSFYPGAHGINDAGNAVAEAGRPGGHLYTRANVPTLMRGLLYPRAINNHGQAAGFGESRSFIWTPHEPNGLTGTLRSLYLPVVNEAWAINDHGVVAGRMGDIAMRWNPADGENPVTALAPIDGYERSSAYGINDHGWVVGSSNARNIGARATLWAPDGRALDMAPVDAKNASWALDINNSGIAVGAYSTGSQNPRYRAMVWSEQEGMLDLLSLIENADGWVLYEAKAINERGQIVGDGSMKRGPVGFILEPIP